MSDRKNKTNKKLHFKSISENLDKEHADIIMTIDNLYNTCKKHWDNEKKLYKHGNKLMPTYHQNINDEWKEHNKEHKDTLKNIKQLKNNIINHINNQDARHFHWVK